jgi:hypothetical protein
MILRGIPQGLQQLLLALAHYQHKPTVMASQRVWVRGRAMLVLVRDVAIASVVN